MVCRHGGAIVQRFIFVGRYKYGKCTVFKLGKNIIMLFPEEDTIP